jgi:hypothetical protein
MALVTNRAPRSTAAVTVDRSRAPRSGGGSRGRGFRRDIAGLIGMRTRMPPVRTDTDSRRLARHRADDAAELAAWTAAAAPGSDPDADQPHGAGPVADRRQAGRDADADAAGEPPRPSVQAHRHGKPLKRAAIRRRFLTLCRCSSVGGVGFVARAGIGFGAGPLLAPGPAPLPLGAGPVGMRMRMRMPSVRTAVDSRCLGPPSC